MLSFLIFCFFVFWKYIQRNPDNKATWKTQDFDDPTQPPYNRGFLITLTTLFLVSGDQIGWPKLLIIGVFHVALLSGFPCSTFILFFYFCTLNTFDITHNSKKYFAFDYVYNIGVPKKKNNSIHVQKPD